MGRVPFIARALIWDMKEEVLSRFWELMVEELLEVVAGREGEYVALIGFYWFAFSFSYAINCFSVSHAYPRRGGGKVKPKPFGHLAKSAKS